MDLAQIGAHCALNSCHELDLLPLTCFCDRQFCKRHIFPDAHDCPVDRSTPTLSTVVSSHQKLRRCAVVNCKNLSLEAYVADTAEATGRVPAFCARCKLAYCATHREPSSHSCPVPEPSTKRKNEEAHTILTKRFPTPASSALSASRPRAKPPTDAKKVAALRKVEIMKMRHHAVPADRRDTPASVPLDQRLFVKARTEGADPGDEKVFWLRTSIGTGRALDLLSAHFALSATDTQPLYLLLLDGQEARRLRNNLPLSDQVEDGSVLVISLAAT